MPPLDAPRTETFKLLKALTALRRELLRAAGEVRLVEASGQLLVLERRHAGGLVRAYFNAGEQARDVPQAPAGSRLLLAVNETAGRADAPLGAWAARFVAVAC
jgi:hypothetical protein